ncbi:MAG: hemin uptake protein HemP [Planctomycetota bacterium]
MQVDDEPTQEDAEMSQANASAIPRVTSEDLFREGAKRIVIQHDGKDYVLLITKRGKLLLNLLG